MQHSLNRKVEVMNYKAEIIKMVKKIKRKDILRYIYIVIHDIMEDEKENV